MISVTILTKNSSRYLKEVLCALREFDEVLIYDNGSTDDTLEIAGQFENVNLYSGSFEGFGPTHNKASKLAKHDWILSVDSDEVVTPEMSKAVCGLNLDENCVYTFPRRNYYKGRWIRCCGWHPDRQTRLYHRNSTRFSEFLVHESIICDHLNVVDVEVPLLHYSYESLEEFLLKMQSYSTLFAQQNIGRRPSSPLKAIAHSFFAFFKSYLIKKGICGGYEGFVISCYNAHTAFYKYLKLYDANMALKEESRSDRSRRL